MGRGPGHSHSHPHAGLAQDAGPRGAQTAGRDAIEVHHDLLAANLAHAEGLRRLFADHGVFAANLMSSPGSGKTALIEATLARLNAQIRVAVIEGDIETSVDADRLIPFAIPVVQINTGPFGGDCHLAAHLVAAAVAKIDLHSVDLLLVENVGNLVCPAEFDIGEDSKVVLLSVTEGEDKPLKYPLMFQEASLALITKIDLLPYLDLDLSLLKENIRKTNPELAVLPVSARTGEGLGAWVAWLERGVAGKRLETQAKPS